MRHAIAVTVITLALIAGTTPGGRAQAATHGSGHNAGRESHARSSGAAKSGAAKAHVGAVRGVKGEAQKPVGRTQQRGAGAVQGAGVAK